MQLLHMQSLNKTVFLKKLEPTQKDSTAFYIATFNILKIRIFKNDYLEV